MLFMESNHITIALNQLNAIMLKIKNLKGTCVVPLHLMHDLEICCCISVQFMIGRNSLSQSITVFLKPSLL